MSGRVLVFVLVLLILVWYFGSSYVRENFKAALPPMTKNDMPGLPFKVRIYNSSNPGKTIMLVGGVHGNEPSGAHALTNLCNMLDSGVKLKRGKLIIVPVANEWGINHYERGNGQFLNSDVNRNFTESGPADDISAALAKLSKGADLVFDFHEGWGYHKINPESIGSTITSSADPKIQRLAQETVNLLNSSITDPGKKFTHRVNDACDITTTLGCQVQRSGGNYMLIETTGQNEIQSRAVRVNQALGAALHVLSAFDMVILA
jgi:hypothetical protein